MPGGVHGWGGVHGYRCFELSGVHGMHMDLLAGRLRAVKHDAVCAPGGISHVDQLLPGRMFPAHPPQVHGAGAGARRRPRGGGGRRRAASDRRAPGG